MPHPPKPKQPKTAEGDPDQYQRFVEMARELGCDESGEAYRRALRVILPPRQPGQPVPRAEQKPTPKGSRCRTTKPNPEH